MTLDTRLLGRRTLLAAALGVLVAHRSASAAAAVRRRPYVQNLRRTRATIRWTTYGPGAASVQIRDAEGPEQVVQCQSQELASEATGLDYTYFKHTAVITGLKPGTEYSYRILVDGEVCEQDDDLVFRTAGTNPFTFLAIGDTGTGSGQQATLAKRIQAENPRLLIHTGDLVYPYGEYEGYETRYFDFYQSMMRRVPFFPCPGNHDYYRTRAHPYISVHDVPIDTVPERDRGRYYSFDWADVHFISLDSNDPLSEAASGRGEMLRWLEADLAATRKFWRVAIYHHPAYAFGPNSRDRESALARSHIVPILERYGVPLVLNGHEHSYQRTHPINGAVHITTGGGGASLYPVGSSPLLAHGASRYHYLRLNVEGRRLTMRAIDADGTQFDETTISPPPLLIRQAVVNSASFTEALGEESIVSIFGWQLAQDTNDDGGSPLADGKKSGVRVTAGNQELSLLMVSPTQVNAILPQGLRGAAELRVSTPGGSAVVQIEIRPVAPALFSSVLAANGTPNSPDSPGSSGSAQTILATGLAGFSGDLIVRLSGQPLPARLSSTRVRGLQQVTFEIPSSLQAGMHYVQVEADGVPSNSISLHVNG